MNSGTYNPRTITAPDWQRALRRARERRRVAEGRELARACAARLAQLKAPPAAGRGLKPCDDDLL